MTNENFSYRLVPVDDSVPRDMSDCTAERFMKAYATILSSPNEDNTFNLFMEGWKVVATETYIMIPEEMSIGCHSMADVIRRFPEQSDSFSIVLVFPDTSIAVCNKEGGVATDVQTVMSDWWITGKAIFDKHHQNTNPDLN